MQELCERMGQELSIYCAQAAYALNAGYWFHVVRETARRTPWCFGQHCASLDVSLSTKLVLGALACNPAVWREVCRSPSPGQKLTRPQGLAPVQDAQGAALRGLHGARAEASSVAYKLFGEPQ